MRNHATAALSRAAILVGLLVAVGLLTACTGAKVTKQGDMTTVAVAGSEPQMCAYCSGKAKPTTESVTAKVVDGTQVATVDIVDGCYSPNVINVKAGMPVAVTFSPSTAATGCIAAPTFKELGKKATAKSQDDTINLGSLDVGTYELSCGMGTVCGAIIAK